ncbi:MAG: hypothetical protein HY820_04445 [Acidobacteria bacterium]|nr:hypothetical protein [Acidobacteriota bacterium]
MRERLVSEEKVFRFITDQIDTIPHMEALLLLWKSRPQAWTEEQVAARLYVDVKTVKRLLQDLAVRSLVHPTEEGPERTYRYESESVEMDRLIEAVAETYRVELLRVSALIHSKASPGIRAFASAFKFTREQD